MIKRVAARTVLYLIMILLAIIAIGPFAWLLSISLKGPNESIFGFPIRLIPEEFTFRNYVTVWTKNGFAGFTLNSAIITAASVVINILVAVTAAYPLARIKFPGRNLIFYGMLLMMIIPFQVILIPLYELCVKLGIDDSYAGIILPFAANVFNIFLIRQAFAGIPDEMEESARIDGCSSFMIWYKIMLPLIKPTISALAIFAFVSEWNNFMWPLIMLKDYNRYTLPLAVSYTMSSFGESWRIIAAGTVVAATPVFLFYIFMQRFFLSGLIVGAVKG